MQKDFDNWNAKKKQLQVVSKTPDFFFHEREKWWCALGVNLGYEQDGKNENFERPVLILRKFNRDLALVVPLTSAVKENEFHHKLNTGESSVILSQIRLVSAQRLLRKIEVIGENEFKEIADKIKKLF